MLFWLWTWLGSAAFIAGLFHSPVLAIVAMYALLTFVLLSIPVFLLALAQMALNRPIRTLPPAVVVRLEPQTAAHADRAHATRSAS